MRHLFCSMLLTASVPAACASVFQTPDAVRPRCIVPAKPGGGMDLSCKLVQKAMPSQQFLITYLPGGVGAVAWTTLLNQRKSVRTPWSRFPGFSAEYCRRQIR
jgi:putative tricarboxylic transport membrane protein